MTKLHFDSLFTLPSSLLTVCALQIIIIIIIIIIMSPLITFSQAAELYLQALSTLSKSDNCTAIRDMISFELSGVYCTIASLLQDYTPISTLSRDQVSLLYIRLIVILFMYFLYCQNLKNFI